MPFNTMLTRFCLVAVLGCFACASGGSDALAESRSAPKKELSVDDYVGAWTWSGGDRSMTLDLFVRNEKLEGSVCCISGAGTKVDCFPDEDNIDLIERNASGLRLNFSSVFGFENQASIVRRDNGRSLEWTSDPRDGENACPSSATLHRGITTR